MKSFKAGERRRQMSLMSSSDLFDGDKGYGRFGHGNWGNDAKRGWSMIGANDQNCTILVICFS